MRRVKVHYCNFKNGKSSKTLQDLLTLALSHEEESIAIRDQIGLRRCKIDESEVLLNRCDETNNFIFGELVLFNKGENITVLASQRNNKVMNLEQIKTPDGKPLVKGITYWFAKRNHFLIVQGANIPMKIINKYLSWLLNEKTKVFPDEIIVDAKLEFEDRNAPSVTSVQIRTSSEPQISYFRQTTKSAGEHSVSDESTIFDVLKRIGFTDANIENLKEEAGPEGSFSLDITFKITENRRRKELSAVKLSSLVPDLDAEVILHGKYGKQVGKLITLNYPDAQVQEIGSLLDPDSVLKAFTRAYCYFVSEGYIEDDEK
ncbi:hypothetical protein BBC0244_017890 [Bartonella apihabitans]|uniref:hypothetical protein n=1 Tax=Bartonella apihabitans TaxID=2750929 RepID=UPI00098F3279|nr:hypothetical protein [Bartonella apihabitans]AQT45467.1 hypothetical protein BBC0244_017890 [Bartonella apihabitans]